MNSSEVEGDQNEKKYSSIKNERELSIEWPGIFRDRKVNKRNTTIDTNNGKQVHWNQLCGDKD